MPGLPWNLKALLPLYLLTGNSAPRPKEREAADSPGKLTAWAPHIRQDVCSELPIIVPDLILHDSVCVGLLQL